MSMQEKVLDRLVVVTKRLADAEGLNKSYEAAEREQAEMNRELVAENRRLEGRLSIYKTAEPRLTALHRAAAALASDLANARRSNKHEDPPIWHREVYRQRGAKIMNREELLKNLDVALSDSYGDCEVPF